jgi:hypothetical protein
VNQPKYLVSPERKRLDLGDRRAFGRYPLLVSQLVEARWKGRRLSLRDAPGYENIGAGGLAFCLAHGPSPPINAELDIRFPLTENPFQPRQMQARCRGRVLRHDAPHRVAVYFEQVDIVREEIPHSRLTPFPTDA